MQAENNFLDIKKEIYVSISNNKYFQKANRFTKRILQVILTEVLSSYNLSPYLYRLFSSEELWNHSVNVMMLTILLAREVKSDNLKLDDLIIGSLFHDLGKIYIPAEILNKSNKLSSDDKKILRLHPIYSYECLKDSGLSKLTLDIVKYHHLNKGYPEGSPEFGSLKYINIVALADAFDAMISPRPYQKAKNIDKAIEEIQNNLGSQFDITYGEIFIELISAIITEYSKEKNIAYM